jgi:hypothetical protein
MKIKTIHLFKLYVKIIRNIFKMAAVNSAQSIRYRMKVEMDVSRLLVRPDKESWLMDLVSCVVITKRLMNLGDSACKEHANKGKKYFWMVLVNHALILRS